jgi:hypothetical protein
MRTSLPEAAVVTLFGPQGLDDINLEALVSELD